MQARLATGSIVIAILSITFIAGSMFGSVSVSAGDSSKKSKTSVVTSKPANDGHFKTGQRGWPGTVLFYLFGTGLGKPVLVLQLRGPHLRMWP